MRTYRGEAVVFTIAHRHGVPWYAAPAPPRRHRHKVQTSGMDPLGLAVTERCPCGAIRTVDAHRGLSDWRFIDAPRVAPRRTLRQLLTRKRATS